MGKNKPHRETLYNAIVIYTDPAGRIQGARFHNIDADKPATWLAVKGYFKGQFPTATYCNLYGGVTRKFIRREKLD